MADDRNGREKQARDADRRQRRRDVDAELERGDEQEPPDAAEPADDAGVRAIGDWTVERIRENRKLPTSRDVRRRAATFCRANGYQVRTDEWLGI